MCEKCPWVVVDGDDVLVSIHVVPNASRTSIVGRYGDRLKVRVAAPPERGKANKVLCRALLKATNAGGAEVVAGHAHNHKTVRLTAVGKAAVQALDEDCG